MRPIVLFHLAVLGLLAQSGKPYTLSGGFLAGSPINDSSSLSSLFATHTQGRWTSGPKVEVHLPRRFSAEFDALFRNSRSNFSTDSSLGKKNVWDFPLLLKCRFQLGTLRPFVSGGYCYSRESSQMTSLYQCSGPQGSCLPAGSRAALAIGGQSHSTNAVRGVAGGVGLEFKTRSMTIATEMRFHRPTNSYPRESRFTGLVGFTFGKRP